MAKKVVVTLADTRVGRRLLLRDAAGFVPIFMMHRFSTPDGTVSGHDPRLVNAALDYLRRNDYQVVSADQALLGLIKGSLPARTIVFTIDDGYWDQGAIGAELFIAHDMPVTIYLATGLTDETFWPVESKVSYLFGRIRKEFSLRVREREFKISPDQAQAMRAARRTLVYELKDSPVATANSRLKSLALELEVELPDRPPPEFAPLSWQEAARLEVRGVSFGAHTVRHVTLSAENAESARDELTDCTTSLRRHLQNPSRVFCYPTGRFQDYGSREVGYLKELGYMGALSAEPGYAYVNGDPDSRFHVLRFGFPNNLQEFKDIVLHLQRFRDRWHQRLRSRRRSELVGSY